MTRAVRLVARREFTERVRERSFLISTGITLVIIVAVVIVAADACCGFGGRLATPSPPPSAAVVRVGRGGRRLDRGRVRRREVTVAERRGARDDSLDAAVVDGGIRSRTSRPTTLVDLLQVANQQLDADAKPPLRVVSTSSRSTPTTTPRPASPSSRS